VAQTFEGFRALVDVPRVLQRIFEQLRRLEDSIELECDPSVGEARGGRDQRAGREELLADVEAVRELTEDAARRDPRSGLDARDVRGRAAGERELSLTQARPLAGFTETCARGGRVVDVC
jgi:hypothetical protein